MLTDFTRIQKDIEQLAAFGATPEGGCTRFSYTEEYRQAADYVRAQMQELGLLVREDALGTLIGRMPGRNPDGPVTLIGSHLDTVKKGGHFDGVAGVVAALETARVLRQQHFLPQNPIDFVALPEGRSARFGSGMLATRALCGQVKPEELLQAHDEDGISLFDAIRSYGGDPAQLASCAYAPGSLGRFLELHIEQGPILENTHSDIGIVDTIAGVHVLHVTVHGRAEHSGTTPMIGRADAFLVTARIAVALNDAAIALADGTVINIGNVRISPDLYNIIPDRADFTIDIRSRSGKSRVKMLRVLSHILEEAASDTGISYEVSNQLSLPPVKLDDETSRRFALTARRLGFSVQSLSSGAFHDAMVTAELCPTAMLFVPSRGGVSHGPEEFTDYHQLQNGIETLCQAVLELTRTSS